MNTFVVADLHMGHAEILKHCRRPWCVPNSEYDPTLPFHFVNNHPLAVTSESLEAHDQAITDAWNRMVGKQDRVIIVGDFAFRDHARHASELNGSKIMIMGNHDDMDRDTLKYFSEVYDFGCVKRMTAGSMEKVTFCHYAMRAWPGSWEGTAALHGHSHGRMPELDILLSFDVGVDVWGYSPIPWDAIQWRINEKRAIMGSRGLAEDGDGKVRGSYSPDPEARVIETRQRNLAALKAVGVEIPVDHFTLSEDCIKALEVQKAADKFITSPVAIAGRVNKCGIAYTKEGLRPLADGESFLWDEDAGALLFRCRAGLAANPVVVAQVFKEKCASMDNGEEGINGYDGGTSI